MNRIVVVYEQFCAREWRVVVDVKHNRRVFCSCEVNTGVQHMTIMCCAHNEAFL